jgi:SAM-dependent methyltransferase
MAELDEVDVLTTDAMRPASLPVELAGLDEGVTDEIDLDEASLATDRISGEHERLGELGDGAELIVEEAHDPELELDEPADALDLAATLDDGDDEATDPELSFSSEEDDGEGPDSEELELESAEIVEDEALSIPGMRESAAPPLPPADLPASPPPKAEPAVAPPALDAVAASAPAHAAEGRASGVPPEPTPSRAAKAKRKRPWYEDFFSDDYLRTVRAPTEREVARECDFIERTLRLEAGSTVLDVGCGLGLHAVELTTRRYLVVGLDLSLPMLSRAADEAQDRGLRINFLHGDMREMTFDGAFDGVLCWGTTFGYFDDESNRKVIQRLHNALRPGGRLLLDSVNRDYVVRSQPNLVWFEGDGCVCMEETAFNYFSSRLEVSRNVILDDGKQRDKQYSIRLYSLHEIGQFLHQSQFRVVEVSGTAATPGVYFGADSPRMIILAERRVEDEITGPPPPPPAKPKERESQPELPPEAEPKGTPEGSSGA